MDDQVNGWCSKLTEAVNIAMNPGVAHSGRLQAYQLCEQFKESAPYSDCMTCGLQLSSINNSTIIRHFGLQLLENCVRFRWNSASPSEKILLKEQVLQLFQNGTHGLMEEQMCVKDGLSRIMVEMIKREWPQQWPSLMSEFNSLCALGDTQTELVLLVLLRLVEDVVTFQSLQTSRRRDVLQALTSNMADLFSFMLQLLTYHVDKYRNLHFSSSMRVAQAVLLTLTGYVDWVSSQHIFAENNALLSTLYSLLDLPQLKLGAVEVLQLVVSRKGKPEERCPLLVLFSADAIKTILLAAESSCGIDLDEENYVFLKRLCQVLTGLGAQLCVLWGSEMKDVGRPESFPDFLQVLLAFLGHPSLHLCSMVVPLLTAFFRHEQISKDNNLLGIVPQILKIMALKLQKVGYPSMDDSPTCSYSVLDYDSDDEFSHNFSVNRLHQAELVRLITGCCPLLIFQVASDWFKQLLSSPLQFEPGREICTPHSPSYVQWDAFTCFFESALGKLFQSDSLREITPQLVHLLQMALAYQIEDPAILSCVLSTISTLFPVVKEKPELVNAFLDKIFSAAVFSLPGQTKTRTRPVQNVRRHACSALVKICRDNSEFMVNFFDPLYDRIKLLNEEQEQLTQMEKSTLNEVLILLSNEFKNIDRQSALIQEILLPVTNVWMSDAMKDTLESVDEFMKHIGLSKVSMCPSQEDREGANRATILTCVATMMAVIKRSKSPQDPKEAQAGGFFVSFHSAGMICRDPCFQHVLPLLGNVLVLMRTMNLIWAPENKGKIPTEYSKVYEIPENDKNAILAVTQPSSDNCELPGNRSTIEKIQNFLCTAQEHCCHVLASACENMGYELYTSAGFFSHLTDSVFWLVNNAPDNRLRPVIRVFMKSLVQHCPVDCQDQALLPILNCLCDFMLQRLSNRWDIINKQQDRGDESESKEANQESQEISDEMFLRLVTRDYLDLLSTVFKKKGDSTETVTLQGEGEMKVEMMESDTMATNDCGQKAAAAVSQLSELGMKILQQEALCKSMVMCIYSALSWNDTQTCIKSLNICWPIFQQIVAKPLVPDAAMYLFTCLLHGLHVHGQHEGCIAPLVQKTFQHYEVLRPRYDILQEVMLQVPGVTVDTLQVFDRRFIFKEDHKKITSEKSRRDNFKQLISGIIGKHIGQMFKREVIIRNLPAIDKPTKQKTSKEMQENLDLGLAVLFADNP